MKKVMASALALALSLTAMAGCASQTQESKEASSSESNSSSGVSSSEVVESKYKTTYGDKKFDNVKITVELFDRANAPEGNTITENKWTKYVNQEMNKVGITVEFVPVPRWDEVTKMQAMMASGTAPDLMITYSQPYVQDYFNQGGAWDLSEFVDGADQAKNLKDYITENVINIGRDENDVLYGLVARRATTAQSNLFIRKDWLDALGLDIPETPDELYDVIYKMVKENPDGRKDAAASIVNDWNLKMAFSQLNGDEKEKNISGGGSTADYYDPGMRDYYRFRNKLYNAGLVNKEYYSLTDDNTKSNIVNGSTAFMEYSVNGNVDVMRGSLLKTLKENVPTADIVSIPPLKNTFDGKQYSATYSANGAIVFCPLTADEEKVEAAVTYLDWLSTKEGGFTIYHGIEGEHYNMVDDVPVVIDATYNAKDKDWIRADLFLIGNQGYFKTVEDFNACTSKEAPGFEQYVIDNYENALKGTLLNSIPYTSPSTPNLTTDIDLANKENAVKCITCPEADFEKTYDEYCEALKAAGAQTIIDERTEYFNTVYGG